MQPKLAQLNPFALPSETTTRFTLLIVAAVALAFNLGLMLIRPLMEDLLIQIAATHQPDLGADIIEYQLFQQRNIMIMRQGLQALSVPLGLTILMLGLALVLYWSHPLWIKFRRRKTSQQGEHDPALLQAVGEIAQAAGVLVPPQVELQKVPSRLHVIGLPKCYVLWVGSSWRLALRKRPASFRLAVLHELAHIVNGDVGRIFFAVALWIALVLMLLIPVAGAAALALGTIVIQRNSLLQELPRLLVLYLQIGSTLAMIGAVRASLLRVREFYADWRVAEWGAQSALITLFERQPQPADAKTSRWKWFWRKHPYITERLAALQQPAHLFRLALDLPFFVGFFFVLLLQSSLIMLMGISNLVLTGASIWVTHGLLHPATSSWLSSSADLAFPLLLILGGLSVGILLVWLGYLVTETLCLEVQREALAQLVEGNSKSSFVRLFWAAVLGALGMETGVIFTPASGLLTAGVQSLAMVPIWTLGLAGLTWVWLGYAYVSAQAVLGTHAARALPTFKRRLLSFSLFNVAAIMLTPLLLAQVVEMVNPSSFAGGLALFTRTLLLSLTLFSMIAIGTWLIITLYRKYAPACCPGCDHVATVRYTVGRVCPTCGQNLAPWLFHQPPASTTAHPTATALNATPSQHPAPGSRSSWRKRGLILSVALVLPLLLIATAVWYWLSFRNELAGTYQIQGMTMQGQQYTGTLELNRTGTTYSATWRTTAGDFTGTGIHMQDILAVVYGDPGSCNLIVFHNQTGNMLEGRWTVNGQDSILSEHAIPVSGMVQPDLLGEYQVTGPQNPQPLYVGKLTIVPRAAVYQLDWQTTLGPGTGTGIRQNELLAVAYGAPSCGVVMYQIQPAGHLVGQWTVQGATQIGSEQGQRVN